MNHINSENIANVFDEHVKCEFVDKDVEATMNTMIKEPYVHHVPVLTGGTGYDGVYKFYKNHFIGRTPIDTNIVHISRTVGKEQVVDEIIISFTHDIEMDFILPGIAPTGRHVRILKPENKDTFLFNHTKGINLRCKVWHTFRSSSGII